MKLETMKLYNPDNFAKYYQPSHFSSWGLTDVVFCCGITLAIYSLALLHLVVLQCIR